MFLKEAFVWLDSVATVFGLNNLQGSRKIFELTLTLMIDGNNRKFI